MRTLKEAGDTISAAQQWYRHAAAWRQRPGSARPSRRQAGDTIVEVLIAIIIISSVLVAAYQTTVKNTATTQDTQEHTVALKIAESQLETLQQNIGIFPSDGSSLCFNGTTPSTADTQCVQTPLSPGTSYNVSLKKTTDGTNAYQAQVAWEGIDGQNNNVTLLYRPENAP